MMAGALRHSQVDWSYRTVPQNKSCLAFKNKECLWSQGKVLGGSSSINFMVYARGNRRDFDEWVALGNKGWDYNNLLPYFKKSENFSHDSNEEDAPFHSRDGPLMVSMPPYHTKLAEAFVKAGNELGYQTRDYNGKYQTGVSRIQATIGGGRRCSTNRAFLQPIIGKRSNLNVITNATVLRILLDNKNRAYGVEYFIDNQTFTIFANKEVILSTGALNSPQLLMLSGIGPKDELEKHNITVKVELPGVGKNFHDHLAAGGIEWLIDQPLSFISTRLGSKEFIDEWADKGQGPLTVPAGVEATAFVHTKFSNPDDDYPDIQLFYASGSPASDGGNGQRQAFGLTDEVWNGYYEPIKFRDTFSIFPVILRPKSRGEVTLNSADPFDPPKVNPAFYTDAEDHDIKRMVQGIHIALKFGNSLAFGAYNATLRNTVFPGCETFTLHSDDYWACVARHFIAVNFHPAGTCSMGKLEINSMAVVDPQLKVHHVNRLRVIDASIMPSILSGNTNAPSIMIGEKGADLIKKHWKLVA
ncbi:hypothetical protein CHUAL_001787 [Chamberlinius hualienensis]